MEIKSGSDIFTEDMQFESHSKLAYYIIFLNIHIFELTNKSKGLDSLNILDFALQSPIICILFNSMENF